jgi:hypothetical protein
MSPSLFQGWLGDYEETGSHFKSCVIRTSTRAQEDVFARNIGATSRSTQKQIRPRLNY